MPLREIHCIGDDTPERIVAGDRCKALPLRGITHLGLSDAGFGYQMARVRPGFAQLLVCTGGSGRVLLDGRWSICREGMAYLTPPLVPHAFETLGRRRWRFCWAFLAVGADRPAPIAGEAPVLVPVDPRPIHVAMNGLHLEYVTQADQSALESWADLVQGYVRRIVQQWRGQDRLWRVWAEVNENLARAWTLADLAVRAGVSSEQVRRLCMASQGRSPVRHITHLRMGRAAALLRSTPLKLQAIAATVGYDNAFTFSTAFKRWAGRSPQAYRRSAPSVVAG